MDESKTITTNELLKEEIEKIKARNARVEMDKAWETSWTHRILILVLTYCVIVIFFFVAKLPQPFTNSIVPTLGFFLSTLTMPWVKENWLKRKNNEKEISLK